MIRLLLNRPLLCEAVLYIAILGLARMIGG